MTQFRLTRQAEQSLVEIARWTFETFGERQAINYQRDILDRCAKIATGAIPSQSCATLVQDSRAELRFVRCGKHHIVFAEINGAVLIIDFIHMRADLPAKLASLGDELLH